MVLSFRVTQVIIPGHGIFPAPAKTFGKIPPHIILLITLILNLIHLSIPVSMPSKLGANTFISSIPYNSFSYMNIMILFQSSWTVQNTTYNLHLINYSVSFSPLHILISNDLIDQFCVFRDSLSPPNSTFITSTSSSIPLLHRSSNWP